MPATPMPEISENQKPTLKALLRMREGEIYLLGLACVLVMLGWFMALSRTDLGKAGTILAVVTTHLTGGRALGISTALSGGFERWEAILLGALIEGAVVCLFFPTFCLSLRRLIKVPFLTDAFANIHRSAQNQRGRMLKWGIPGLILFVWFPFFMTGPVVGSVIGFLLGMRPWVVTGVVLCGTTLAIVSWTFIIDQVVDWSQRIGEFIPWMLVCIVLILVVSFRISRYREAQQRAQAARLNGAGNGELDAEKEK